jgi:Phosphotransferase system, mannose/fructose-specific component IIA
MSDAPAAPAAPRALVIGHADFAHGLISAVDQITGRGDLLVGLSIAGMTPKQMEEEVAAHLRKGVQVIFTDLPGGSATTCSRRVCGVLQGPVVVSGVNLPTLLEFVLSADTSPGDAERAAERGRGTLGVYGAR